VALAAVCLGPGASRAHFVLQSPDAAHVQGPYGDPQKAPPCGDDGSAVATGMVTAYQGGDVLTITIDETIFHPGHYRVALAVNDMSELPAEPIVTPNETDCGTAPIDAQPVFPVLADGVFLHTEPFSEPQSIDIVLPTDVSCESCTLQVIQFMSNHGLNNPGGCYYHHCATISLTPGASSTSSTSVGETGGDESASDPTATTGASPTTDQDPTTTPGETGAGGTGGGTTGVGDTGGAATVTGDATTGGATATSEPLDDEKGCACDVRRGGGFTGLLLLGLLGLGVRRRR